MLQMTDVTFSYGSRKILSALSLQAPPGECLVIAGPNGSGKSTLLALLAGVLTPDSGAVRTDGRVGYVPQGIALFGDMTVEENLRFFAGLARSPIPSPLPFGLEARLHTRVDRLSGGTQRQVSIACALPGDPEVLLLDEPCAGLDLPYAGS
jgi:ABC-2 type transport system ATP-binding protein